MEISTEINPHYLSKLKEIRGLIIDRNPEEAINIINQYQNDISFKEFLFTYQYCGDETLLHFVIRKKCIVLLLLLLELGADPIKDVVDKDSYLPIHTAIRYKVEGEILNPLLSAIKEKYGDLGRVLPTIQTQPPIRLYNPLPIENLVIISAKWQNSAFIKILNQYCHDFVAKIVEKPSVSLFYSLLTLTCETSNEIEMYIQWYLDNLYINKLSKYH